MDKVLRQYGTRSADIPEELYTHKSLQETAVSVHRLFMVCLCSKVSADRGYKGEGVTPRSSWRCD